MNEIIKKNGITFGVISGLISIVLFTIIYIIDLELMLKWWFSTLSIVIAITLSVVLLSKTKKELNGVFTFKDAFTTYFIYAVIGIALSTVFQIILFNVIDPSAKETLKELVMKFTQDIMKKFGAPSSEMKKALKELSEKDPYSAFEMFKGMFGSIAVSSVFGLILAAIFKTPNKQEI
jgi:hypothetical protein